ncbi:MAG: choice-of-anchor T family protein, partial [Candidatus Thermoplasmatota archaeon]|nr:choice-of-anchor T family protein [Candidatus Thermoplasmatota archaeon]
YVEKVAIQVTSDGLATAAPGDMYVGASQEVDFQVVVRANPYMQMQSRQLTVSAQVQEINNLPPPNTASSQVNALINIMQFSIVQVEAVEPFVQLMPKTDKNFQFKVYNFGNQIDRMKIGVTENTRETLEEAGFTVNLPQTVVTIEPNTAPETARIMVRTPKNQGWSDAYHVLEFYAESEFACQNGGCNRESQMITVYVRGVYLPGFEVVPAISMIALAGAVAGRRFLNTDEEGDEEAWRESAPGL